MAEKILNTRIQLKIDTLENWEKSTIGLKKGELAIATVAATAGTGLTEPVCMIKVGEDGVKTFKQLDWNVYAKASDVLSACKSEASLKNFVNGVIADAGIASSDAMEALADRVNILEGNDETAGSVAKSIKDAIAALKLEDTYVKKVTGMSLVADAEIMRLAVMSDGANKVEASTNGKIKIDGIDTVVYTHPDKHTIDDVTGLQNALDGKQAAGDYAAEEHTHTASEVTDFATEVAKIKVNEAVKATQDGNGKVIADTYAEKATTLAGYNIGNAYTKDETDTAVQGAKDYAKGLVDAIPAQIDYTVTINEVTDGLDSNVAKKYTFTQNGQEIGSINLAKELVVTSGSVKEVTETGKPYAGAVVGDKYIELVIANQETPIYVPAKDLVDIYTAASGASEVQVAISNTNEISATLTDVVKEKLNKAHTHSFTDETALNGITAAKVEAWDNAVSKEHTHTFVENELNQIKSGDVAKWNAAEGKAHEHDNKNLLDTYTQTEDNLADAVAKKHEHTFVESELNKIADGDVAKWNDAETKAHEHNNKNILDSITSAMISGWNTRVVNVSGAANSGLKATKDNNNAVTIDFDDTVTFVFDCGDSGVTA